MARHVACGLLAVLVLGACGTPAPSPSGSVPAPPRSSIGPSNVPSLRAASSPSPSTGDPFASLVDLGTEIEVGVLGPKVTGAVLEFASDGQSILFSSDLAGDVGPEAAPDLWRFDVFGDRVPKLVWRNPARDHSIVKIAGDLGAYAFAEMPLTGERAWNFWFIPRHADEAILLDSHPGDADVPDFVPSFSVGELDLVWTAFDRGPNGAASQLMYARAPSWEPQVLLERRASEAELWLPSLSGSKVAFTEVIYSPDRESDERHVQLLTIGDPTPPQRLDTSGRATMPVIVQDAIFWKQADPGFNMFNWGRMFRYDLATGEVAEVDASPQTYVNYPSGGSRFLAWWGNDSFQFGVYDHILGQPRTIERNPTGSDTSVLRPHLAWDLLVWLRVEGSSGNDPSELRYADLPDAKPLRR